MISPQRLLLVILIALIGALLVGSHNSDAERTTISSPGENSKSPGFIRTTVKGLLNSTQQGSTEPWTNLETPGASFIARRGASGLNRYRALDLDIDQLRAILKRAPLEFTQAARDDRVIFWMPKFDGSFARFAIEEAPILEEPLGKRFPEIKTYRGFGIDDITATTRFDLTPQGFHGIIISSDGTTLIEPDEPGAGRDYVAYSQGEIPTSAMQCEVDGPTQELANQGRRSISPLVSSGATLRTYRLAVAATAEFTNTYGSGSVNLGLAAVTTTINLVNAIYERELAIRLVLVANNDQLIFTDTTTDGYTHDSVGALINENPGRINAIIGSANYDIGHVFDGRTSGGFSWQGQASLSSVCNAASKARGVSITRNLSPSNLYAYYSNAHEIGHQFGAFHTFNASTGFCGGQRASTTAYEPGTGSTIMGYRLNCGSEDLNSMDTYFHHVSLEQMVTFVAGAGGTCGAASVTGNNIPTVDAGSTYTIPRSTPFTLTATGSDSDGDPLTYCWEQYDLGPASPPSTDDGSRPIMRSYAPTTDPFRIFPRGANSGANAVPFDGFATTTRTLNFRVTARDNRGAINSDGTQINVREDVGPFEAISMSGQVNTVTTVNWNVRNTNQPPVDCSAVRISLSVDDGQTYPIILASNTPNDGSEAVMIPGLQTPTARVKVEAIGNVFFSVTPAFLISGTPNPTPTIAWFSPSTETPGNSVRITGTNLISPSSVKFNGIEASFTVSSTTEVIATVPAGNTNGPITVTTPYGMATSSSVFGTAPVYVVEGRVMDSGNPVAGVTLNLELIYQGVTTNTTAVTDANGNYRSANLGCQTTVKITPFKFGFSFDPRDTTLTYPFCVSGKGTADFTAFQAGPNTLNMSQTYDTNEAQGTLEVRITRSGGTSGSAGFDYATSDTDNFTVACSDRVGNMGAAFARCDYAISRDTVIFQPGETSKTILIPIVNDSYAEGVERFSITLSNAVGTTLGPTSTATLMIFDNETSDGANPVSSSPFFVRQHYLDFLSREPDQAGFNAWVGVLNNCPNVNNDPTCDRILVSKSFFESLEFQLKGYFVYRFYKLAFNRLPTYSEIVVDMRLVTGQTPNEVFQKKAQFTNAFVLRTDFANLYSGLSNTEYVGTLMNRYGLTQVTTPNPDDPDSNNKVTLTTADLVSRLNALTLTRAKVLRAIADSDQVFSAEFNAAFVAMQYYGYLRRTPEAQGYQNWLNHLNANPNDIRTMVDGFMNSQEYRLRFGP